MAPRTTAIHQMVSVLRLDDAVGNIVLAVQRQLRSWGYQSTIFARTDEQSRSFAIPPEQYSQVANGQSVVLVHHSFESRLVPIIRGAPGRKAIVYHGITPAHFFERFDSQLAAACSAGRDELFELASICERAYGLSQFSADELDDAGFANISVLPLPLIPPALETAPDGAWISRFNDGCFNVLFVGRVAPNKRLEDVLGVFAAFQRLYQPKSRLLVAGEFRVEGAYARWLNAIRSRLHSRRIHFLGQLNDSQLSACYQLSHLYLSMSQHEGLGLPLLEAMHRHLPVVAYGAAAVPETMGGAGVVTMTRDPFEVAKLLAVVDRNPELRRRIVDRQNQRVAAMLPDREGSALRRALEPLFTDDSKVGGHRRAS